jgi:hypothetical protein
MGADYKCTQCGCELWSDLSPQGVCPKCLLHLGLDEQCAKMANRGTCLAYISQQGGPYFVDPQDAELKGSAPSGNTPSHAKHVLEGWGSVRRPRDPRFAGQSYLTVRREGRQGRMHSGH